MITRKLMLLGDMGVGKTSLAKRLVFDAFDASYKPTIGVDIYRFAVTAPIAGGGSEPVELIIWDTDGDFGDSIFRHVYMQGASAALIVADAMRRPTQESSARLAEGFIEAMPGRPFAVVINKVDLLADETQLDLPATLQAPGLELVRTSALNGENVVEAFAAIAAAIVRRGL
jgi:small GTP-binding protein